MNISRYARFKSGAAPVVLGIALLSTPAFAQSNTQVDQRTSPQDDSSQTEIIVTGSRIATSNVGTTAPVQVISGEAIQSTGAVNIQDVLLNNPAFGTPTYARTNTSFATSGAGISTLDLRNLGIDRTLVLVNGRRMVSGIPGSQAVDLNTIPTALIDRVDTLTSGSGSAVYGSDAVAGVVNFILKDDFEGLQIDAQSGISQAGDNFTLSLGATLGANFADGRGNVTMFLGYSEQGAAWLSNHRTEAGRSGVDSLSAYALDDEANPFERLQPFYSSYAPQGTYLAGDQTFSYDADGNLINRRGAGFNRAANRYLAIPTQRYMVNALGHYDVSDNVTAFFEASFVSTNIRSNIEAFPWDTETSYEGGAMPIETMFNGSAFRNPFVPDAIFNAATDTDGDGLRDIFVSKRLNDFGPRTNSATRQTFRIVGGLRGNISDLWKYEVFGNYGQTNTTQTGTGQINVLNFANSQRIIPDGSGGYMCADASARAQGCVPANVFGTGSLAGAVDYLQAPSYYVATQKQTQVGANLTGQLFSISGVDRIGVTVGTEYRRESSSDEWDALQTLGLNGGNALPPTRGAYDVYEFYGEALVPLIQESFVHNLSVRGAARYSHYSTVGGTFSWNAGIDFAPIEDIRFRAMYAQTVRAPNISELYSGRSQTFPTVSDPCVGIGATGGGALGDNCRAAPGVMANIAANGVFTLNQSDIQGVTGFEGGNPSLQEEKGKTWTAGVVINPRSIDALRNFTLSVDYFNVKINDAIVSTSRAFILDQCYNGGVQAMCDFIVRRSGAMGLNSAGSLDEVNTAVTNSGGFQTSGIDVVLAYNNSFDLGSRRLAVGLTANYTHMISGWSRPVPGGEKDRFMSNIGASRDRFNLGANFQMGKVRWTLGGTYVGGAYLDESYTGFEPGSEGSEQFRVHPEFYLDTQVRFIVSERSEFYVGAENLLGNDPVYFGGLPDAATGMDSDYGTYRGLGRNFYAGIKLRF